MPQLSAAQASRNQLVRSRPVERAAGGTSGTAATSGTIVWPMSLIVVTDLGEPGAMTR